MTKGSGKDAATGWPAPAQVAGQVRLELGKATAGDPRHDLSAATRLDISLFLGADEAAGLERLTLVEPDRWSSHTNFTLKELLDLADPEEEVDIEGLATEDGWLWIVGSHSRTREKPPKGGEDTIDVVKLADLKDTRARCLLARLPLVADPSLPGAVRPVRADGIRRAGMVKQTGKGSKLAEALASDSLLAPFTRIPAKEGGVDIEGVAVAGNRVALGMRGPVIRDYALLLELTMEFKPSGRLKLAGPPAKRLLDLEGLGIRDLKRSGQDLLILAGPTTSLDGPCALYRWTDWLLDAAGEADTVRLHHPRRLFDIPFGRGEDHPEGLALWQAEDGSEQIMVVCDSPRPGRLDARTGSFTADLFHLPR